MLKLDLSLRLITCAVNSTEPACVLMRPPLLHCSTTTPLLTGNQESAEDPLFAQTVLLMEFCDKGCLQVRNGQGIWRVLV
jgi:hypothetical protein